VFAPLELVGQSDAGEMLSRSALALGQAAQGHPGSNQLAIRAN
jgi:hypothetical protein